MESSWWDERSACPKSGSKSSNNKSKLSLSAVAGIFYILILGMTTAIACSLLEYWYFKHRKQKDGDVNDVLESNCYPRSFISGKNVNSTLSQSSSTASNSSSKPILTTKSRNVSFVENLNDRSSNFEKYDIERPSRKKMSTFGVDLEGDESSRRNRSRKKSRHSNR